MLTPAFSTPPPALSWSPPSPQAVLPTAPRYWWGTPSALEACHMWLTPPSFLYSALTPQQLALTFWAILHPLHLTLASTLETTLHCLTPADIGFLGSNIYHTSGTSLQLSFRYFQQKKQEKKNNNLYLTCKAPYCTLVASNPFLLHSPLLLLLWWLDAPQHLLLILPLASASRIALYLAVTAAAATFTSAIHQASAATAAADAAASTFSTAATLCYVFLGDSLHLCHHFFLGDVLLLHYFMLHPCLHLSILPGFLSPHLTKLFFKLVNDFVRGHNVFWEEDSPLPPPPPPIYVKFSNSNDVYSWFCITLTPWLISFWRSPTPQHATYGLEGSALEGRSC